MLNTRGVLGGMLALLLVSGVACKQPPSVQVPAQTVSTDTPEIAALRVKANAGDAESQHNLAVMYEIGQHVPRDYGQSVAWLRKAAEQGLAIAQSSIELGAEALARGVPWGRPTGSGAHPVRFQCDAPAKALKQCGGK